MHIHTLIILLVVPMEIGLFVFLSWLWPGGLLLGPLDSTVQHSWEPTLNTWFIDLCRCHIPSIVDFLNLEKGIGVSLQASASTILLHTFWFFCRSCEPKPSNIISICKGRILDRCHNLLCKRIMIDRYDMFVRSRSIYESDPFWACPVLGLLCSQGSIDCDDCLYWCAIKWLISIIM